tara:strand:- start:2675 stop:3271 length:597 start_codon:yes stop_codon:yes gene_type:complete
MPNWCNNDLYISGDKDSIKKFKLAAKGPTQTYNDFREHESKWPEKLDDIRLKVLSEQLPEPGPVSDFSFHALFPVPDEIRRLPYDCNQANKIRKALGLEGEVQGGYSWESSNWGCKWGASEAALWSSEESFLHYGFDTPWGPPEPFIDKISKDWPDLHFELHYEEPGMNFRGEYHVQNGEELYSYTAECDEPSEDEEE